MRSEGYGTWFVCRSVSLFVCLLSTFVLELQATRQLISTKVQQGLENNVADLAKNTAFKSYSVKTKQTSQYAN